MCGHVGIAGKLAYKDEATMKRLLMFDYFRGPDSTGLAAVFDDDIKIAKIASHPVNLFDTTRFKTALNAFKSKALIGHNRAATKGAVNDVNAHPYHHGHIVGAHNGTLTQPSWDKLQEIIGEKTGTDSDAIFAAIAKVGIDEVSKHLQGAWALVWFDTQDNTLNFLRNKERPFWYAYSKTFNQVFWASEHWMLRAAVTAAPEKDKYDLYVDDKGYSFYSTQEDWHYRYDLDELTKGSEGRPKPRVKELKGKEPAPVQSVSYGNFPRVTHQGGGTTGSTTTSRESVITLKKLVATTADPFGGYLSKAEFDDVAKYGCGWCQKDVHFEDEGVIFYEADRQIIGACCSNRKTNRIYGESKAMTEFLKTAPKDDPMGPPFLPVAQRC
jgi:predicted glutamine amidotransferase